MTVQFKMHMCSVMVFTLTPSGMPAATGHMACISAGKSLGENQLTWLFRLLRELDAPRRHSSAE
jgi:hypothetical protein